MKTTIAVVTAGGFGNRLGLGVPKSLVLCERVPMITHVLSSLLAAGVNRFIVWNNRPEFGANLRDLCSAFPAIVLEDEGVDCTIALAQRAASFIGNESFLFAYGHAPRPSSFVRRMLELRAEVVATGVASSSRMAPILGAKGRWIEPPYRIRRGALESARFSNWREFFCHCPTAVLNTESWEPGEFNSLEDLGSYCSYVATSVIPSSHACSI